MTGKENVLIKKKTLKIIIVLVLLDIFFAEFVFQYGAQPTGSQLFFLMATGMIQSSILILLLIMILQKKETCTCCNEKYDKSYSFCPYCGAPKIRSMTEDQKLHKYVVDGIDDFKYSAIKDDRDADQRLMDDEPETDDTDDNIDVKRAEAVIEDQLKSNQDFVESLGE